MNILKRVSLLVAISFAFVGSNVHSKYEFAIADSIVAFKNSAVEKSQATVNALCNRISEKLRLYREKMHLDAFVKSLYFKTFLIWSMRERYSALVCPTKFYKSMAGMSSTICVRDFNLIPPDNDEDVSGWAYGNTRAAFNNGDKDGSTAIWRGSPEHGYRAEDLNDYLYECLPVNQARFQDFVFKQTALDFGRLLAAYMVFLADEKICASVEKKHKF